MLGRRAERIVAEAYLEPDNDYSFHNVTFAERDGALVGMVLGFTAEERRRFSGEPLKRAAGFPALRMRTVRILFAPLLRIVSTVAEGDFYLLAMAVDPALRGAGIGSTLLDIIEERARLAGSTRLQLDVAAKNEAARRLYVRRGWSEESRWPKTRFLPCVFVRMAKTL